MASGDGCFLPDGCYSEVRTEVSPFVWSTTPRDAQVNTEEVFLKDDAAILEMINLRAAQLLHRPLEWNSSSETQNRLPQEEMPALSFGEVVHIPALYDALHLAKFYEPFRMGDDAEEKEEESLATVFSIPYVKSRGDVASASFAPAAPLDEHDKRYRLPSNQLPQAIRAETNASVRTLALDRTYVGRRHHLVSFVLMCLFCPNVQELRLPGHLLSRSVLLAIIHVIRKNHPSLRSLSIPMAVIPFDLVKKLIQALRDNVRVTTVDVGGEANKNILPAQRKKLEEQVMKNKQAMRLVEGMRSALTWTTVPTQPLPSDVARALADTSLALHAHQT